MWALAGRQRGGQYRGAGRWGGVKSVGGGVEPSACGRRARGALVFHGKQPAGRARQAGSPTAPPAVQSVRHCAAPPHPTPPAFGFHLPAVGGHWLACVALEPAACLATQKEQKRSGFRFLPPSIPPMLRQLTTWDGNRLSLAGRWTGCCRAPSAVLVCSNNQHRDLTVTGSITGLACPPENLK